MARGMNTPPAWLEFVSHAIIRTTNHGTQIEDLKVGDFVWLAYRAIPKPRAAYFAVVSCIALGGEGDVSSVGKEHAIFLHCTGYNPASGRQLGHVKGRLQTRRRAPIGGALRGPARGASVGGRMNL